MRALDRREKLSRGATSGNGGGDCALVQACGLRDGTTAHRVDESGKGAAEAAAARELGATRLMRSGSRMLNWLTRSPPSPATRLPNRAGIAFPVSHSAATATTLDEPQSSVAHGPRECLRLMYFVKPAGWPRFDRNSGLAKMIVQVCRPAPLSSKPFQSSANPLHSSQPHTSVCLTSSPFALH